jgi:DHA2 family multidrug resistance protein
VDRFGIGLLAIGMVSLQYVLEEGNRDGWFESPLITFLAVVAGIALVGFISHELETPHPVVELRVFKNRAYAAATTLNFLVGTALFAGSLLFSLYCGTIMHYRALDIGRIFLLGTWVQLLIFPVVGRLVTKIDARLLLVVSTVGIVASLWLNAHLTTDAGTKDLVAPLFVRAIGTGFGFVPLTMLGVASLSPAQRPGGTALFNLTRELGASIGTAWMSTMLDRLSKQNFNFMTSHVTVASSTLVEQASLLAHGPGARLPFPDDSALAVLKGRIAQQALLRAFNGSFLLLALAFLCVSWVILFMRAPQRGLKVDTNAH